MDQGAWLSFFRHQFQQEWFSNCQHQADSVAMVVWHFSQHIGSGLHQVAVDRNSYNIFVVLLRRQKEEDSSRLHKLKIIFVILLKA